MKKKLYGVLSVAVLSFVLAACGRNDNESNRLTETTEEVVSDSVEESVNEVNSIGEDEIPDVAETGFINVNIENGFVSILINHVDMTRLNNGDTEAWIRFYDNEDRLSGIEIKAKNEQYTVVPIPFNGEAPLVEGNNAYSYVAGTVLSFDFMDEELAQLIGSSDYYEIIVRDWNDESTPKMIMYGETDTIEGIHIYKVANSKSGDEGNNSSQSQMDDTGEEDLDTPHEGTSQADYLNIAYSDGISTIIFHGTNPTNPTSMMINGEKIVFDEVIVDQNDGDYLQLSLYWTIDDCSNWGVMYYSFEDQHIVLKGFAVANEYEPVK